MILLENEQLQGWDAVNAAYKAGFSDPNKMGDVQPVRTQVRITKPGLALVQDEWMVRHPSENKQVVGSSTMTVQKLGGAWKIISSYSRFSPATSRRWEYDSIAPQRAAATPSLEQDELKTINDLLVRMDASWTAHDIDGVMSAYWNSPHLLVVIQEEQFQGWEVLYHAYKTGYPDPNAMGHVEPSRVQIRFLKSDVAAGNNWRIVPYTNFKSPVIWNQPQNPNRLSQRWKIRMGNTPLPQPHSHPFHL